MDGWSNDGKLDSLDELPLTVPNGIPNGLPNVSLNGGRLDGNLSMNKWEGNGLAEVIEAYFLHC
jgi:hypothetical protein